VSELKHDFRDFGRAGRVSRRDRDRALAVDELSVRLGRSATPSELAAALGISIQEVLDALETAANVHPGARRSRRR